ncbi:MAG: hypothetical protein JNL62_09935 [Bryobacterales bacterium]|nr:hypothetical protein [Bryobacterales bacterium]
MSRNQAQKAPAKSGPQKLSDDQARNLASDLRTYAVWAIEQVAKEYGYQMSKWERSINLVADAQAEAHARHKRVLDEMAANDAFMLMALSFVAGPMLSWVSGAIQYTLYPRYAKQLSARKGVSVANKEDYSKVAAKIFGDTGAATVQLGTDKVFRMSMPTPSSQIESAIAAEPNVGSFKTILQNELSVRSDSLLKSINRVGQDIQEDLLFGQQVLEKMYRTVPGSEYFPYYSQEAAAKGFIRNDVNSKRAEWAAKWQYYGKDPNLGAYELMVRTMEKEVWALWILNQKYKAYESPGILGGVQTQILGEDDGIRSEVVRKLVDLDIVLAQLEYYGGDPVWPFLPKPKPIEKSEKQVEQQLKRRKEDPSLSVPVLREGPIDTKEELRMLNDWAAHHKPVLLGGTTDHVTRKLPALNEIHNQ